ncbi:UTP3 family protein [Megaselia abdita]
MDKIKFNDNDFEGGFDDASDSEADYSEDEKRLLKAVRKARGKKQDSKNEVFGFDDEEDEDDEDADLADSDIEGKGEYDEEEGIPDSKAWGQSRKSFYHTDFVDQDYSSYNPQEEEDAKQEEEEAKNIQQRLAKELDEADFFLDTFQETKDEPKVESKTKVKTDYSNLSKAQKLELFHKENPEFQPLFEDFKKFNEEKSEILDPVVKYAKETNLEIPIIDFVKTRSKIVNLFILNLSFYFVLKSKKQSIRNHPVAKTLAQYKKLLNELQPIFEQSICPELMKLFPYIDSGEALELDEEYYKDVRKLKAKEKTSKKQLEIMKSVADDSEGSDDDDDNLPVMESAKIPETNKVSDSEDSEKEQNEDEEEEVKDEEDEKRGITYQMAKNKGLMPSRKKEVRNPRVKNKLKFRKANIRRKGAVRTVRKELSRYGGEMSGIKATVKKGVKIRS